MRIKALKNIGTNDYPGGPIPEGEERDLDAVAGKRLVAIGAAVEVTTPPEVTKIDEETAAAIPVTPPAPNPETFNQLHPTPVVAANPSQEPLAESLDERAAEKAAEKSAGKATDKSADATPPKNETVEKAVQDVEDHKSKTTGRKHK